MKTLLILILAAGLVAAAFFTRPSKSDFDAYVKAQLQAGGTGSVKDALRGLANNISADAYLRAVTYHDHVLWVTVEQNGQSQYLGAFSHWFQRGSTGASKAPAA